MEDETQLHVRQRLELRRLLLSNIGLNVANQTKEDTQSSGAVPGRKPICRSSRLDGLWARLYEDRKLVFCFLAHLILTLAVWQHHFYFKFKPVTTKLDEATTNRYWWKVLVPPVEFGAMHAILLQMALLPLTMS
eukprot:3258663-Pyramimonas_sp.AAC.1